MEPCWENAGYGEPSLSHIKHSVSSPLRRPYSQWKFLPLQELPGSSAPPIAISLFSAEISYDNSARAPAEVAIPTKHPCTFVHLTNTPLYLSPLLLLGSCLLNFSHNKLDMPKHTWYGSYLKCISCPMIHRYYVLGLSCPCLWLLPSNVPMISSLPARKTTKWNKVLPRCLSLLLDS